MFRASFRNGAVALFVLSALVLGTWVGQHLAGASPVASTTAAVLGVPTARAQSLRDLETTADVAELVMPSVVNISTSRTVSMENHPFFIDPMFRRFFDGRGREPQERESNSLGSGVIISRDGYVITNNHVVAEAEEIQVSTDDGKVYYAEVIGTDELSDLALLKIDADDLTPIAIGDSELLRVGEAVMAVGNPFGVGQTVTMGIVSAKGRAIGLINYEDFIQTDAAINPGNSGGALVNMHGELVGVNSAILSRSGGSQGIGFAIPTSLASVVIDNLREHGRVVRGYLGVQPQDLDSATAMSLGLDEGTRGVLISDVLDGSPASDAGLERYDIVVGMNGEPVESATSFRNHIGHMPPGTEVDLEIIRDGRAREKTVALGERPDQQQISQNDTEGESDLSLLEGLRVYDSNSRAAQQFNLPRELEGPVVIEVSPRTPASHAGLQPGDVILEVNRRSVNSVSEFEGEVRDAVRDDDRRPVALLVQRRGSTVFVALSPR